MATWHQERAGAPRLQAGDIYTNPPGDLATIWREATVELATWRLEWWNLHGRNTRHSFIIRSGSHA